MRTQIKVTDLSQIQWEYLTHKVPVDGREFVPGIPRSCVTFELSTQGPELHIEMDLVELAGLMVTLSGIQLQATARAVLTPDALHAWKVQTVELTCGHGSPVTGQTISAFEGAAPVRTYEDGCQSFGPYQSADCHDVIDGYTGRGY